MRVMSYSGTIGDCIEVDKPSDLYSLIDWFLSKMKDNNCDKKILWKIHIVMDCAETVGLGNEEEVEKVNYI